MSDKQDRLIVVNVGAVSRALEPLVKLLKELEASHASLPDQHTVYKFRDVPITIGMLRKVCTIKVELDG